MMKNYHTAIVTGASHGIGPFIVRALAKEGMNLVLAARSGQELEQVATAADIRAGQFPAKPGFICRSCAYRPICPAHEEALSVKPN